MEDELELDFSDLALSEEEGRLFDQKPFDAEGARKKMIARIERTKKQLNNEKVPSNGDRDFRTGHNNQVEYTPTVNGQTITLPGVTPSTRYTRANLQTLLERFGKAVEAGKFDSQLQAALASNEQSTSTGSTGRTRGSGGGLGNKAQPDNPEWMAKFREKRGKPDASIVDPVPNAKGTRWISRSRAERGKAGAKTRFG